MSEKTTTNGRGGPELFKDLAAFQATKPAAKMDAVNPHFKSKYATLASVLEASRPMTEFGLSVAQLVNGDEVETMLCHSSGEYLSTVTRIIVTKDNAHGYGAGITYARRYALSAILGICNEEDDDGNAAIEGRRKAAHHQDHKNGRTKILWPRLKELGLDSEEVNDYVVRFKQKRLSGLSKGEMGTLVDGLAKPGSDIQNHFNAWRADRAKASTRS